MENLIIGIPGQIGLHLTEQLPIDTTIGICRIPKCSSHIKCDLGNYESIFKIIKRHLPKTIFHLATYHYRLNELFSISEMYKTNVIGTINLLEAIKSVSSETYYNPVVVVTSTQAVYAQGNEPYREDFPVIPSSLYALSKYHQEQAAQFYFEEYGLNIIISRLSAITGPRVDHRSVYDFCRKVMMIESGELPPKLTVGNLNPYRSITHASDVADALIKLSNCESYGSVFNICSEQYYKISDVLEIVRSKCNVYFDVEIKSDLFPSTDVFQVGNSEKLRLSIDWLPKYSLDETIEEMLNHFREQSRRTPPFRSINNFGSSNALKAPHLWRRTA